MAIQSNIPFQLQLISGPEWNAETLPITRFYDQARLDGAIEPAVAIKENTELAIMFTCANPQARFYMDGLETLPQERLAEDSSGRSYLSPRPYPIPLFSYIDYPLIPGYYWLEVVTMGQHYFAPLQVEPKRLTSAQWEVMRQELNNELYNLALDLIRQSTGVGEDRQGALPLELLHRFIVIRQHFPSVMAALNDLLTRANYRVRKTHQLLPLHRVREFDDKAARYQLARPDGGERLATPVPKVDYDLPENRWVKHILRVVSGYLSDFCTAIATYSAFIKQQADELQEIPFRPGTTAARREKLKLLAVLHDYEETAIKMVKAVELLRWAPWYNLAGNSLPTYYPQALTSDARYSALYALYRQLRAEGVVVAIDDEYSYQWRRTDQLYELWCFVKLYRVLVDPSIGFQPKSGWLFDSAFASGTMLIPVFQSGAGILLGREADNVTLHLVFDAELPRQSQDTEFGKAPLFTRGMHNRPDGRLDIYSNSTYSGSIIFDFKYRPLYGFWDASAITGSLRPKAMNQLISYASDIRSPYLHTPCIDQRWRQSISPIHEVWAVFPGTNRGGFHNEIHPDHSVRLISLAPDTDLAGFAAVLGGVIDSILAKAK